MPTIQTLTADHFTDWEPLWLGYLGFYESSLSDAVTRTSFARLTSGIDPMGGFLARDERGAAIGLVHGIKHRSTWSDGDYCYLQDLFAAPEARGSGIGRALIEAVYDQARLMGCSRVYWLTHESNVNAMQLYDRIADKSGFLQYKKLL